MEPELGDNVSVFADKNPLSKELMPPSYVKAYVSRGKTDAADAAAICEASKPLVGLRS